MKQTNSAIKFLVAQYRAIFKNANLKMFLAVATAAATMTASQASAAGTNLSGDNWDAAFKASDTVEINGKDDSDGKAGKYKNLVVSQNKSGTVTLNLKNGQKIVISDEATTGNSISASGSGAVVDLTGNGDLNITAHTKDASNIRGLSVKASDSGSVSLSFNNVNINSDLSLLTEGKSDDSKVSLKAKSITIGDGEFIAGTGNDKAVRGRATLTVGAKDASGSATLGDASTVITINKDGKLRVAAGGSGSTIEAAKVVADSGIISFGESTANKHSVYKVAQTDVNNGWLSVKSGSNAQFELGAGGKFNVNGTSVADVADELYLKTGTVTVGDDVKLVAASGATGTDAQIKVGGDAQDNATLVVSKATLKGFLTGKQADGQTAIKYTDENAQFTDTANKDKTAASGNILLGSGGTLSLTDVENIDLADTKDGFTFSGSSGAGAIGVTAGGSIFAKNLTVSAALKNADKLTVKATNLTLGKGDAALTDKLGVAGYEAENVAFKNSGSDFNLLEDLTLKTQGNGTISGGVIIGKTGSGANLTIAGGNYTLEAQKNLEIASGSLVLNNGSSLVLTGNLKNAADGKIELNDASTLDASGVKNLTLVASGGTPAATVNVKKGSTLVLDQADVFKKGTGENEIALVTGDSSVAKGAISLDKSSVLEFKLAQDMSSLNKTQIGNIKSALADSGIDGIISFGDNFTMSGISGDVAMKDVMENADVYGGHGVTTADGQVSGSIIVGNIKIDAADAAVKSATIAQDKSVVLYNAGSAGFVSKGGKAADVALASGASITLAGTGSIGAIDGSGDNSGSVVIGHSKKDSTAVVAESVGSTHAVAQLDIAGNSSLTLTKEGAKVQTQILNVGEGASLTAAKQDIVISSSNGSGSSFMGDVTANSLTLTVNGSNATTYKIAGGATVDVKKLTLSESGTMTVGQDGDNSSSGTLEVETLKLAKGTLIVDPEFADIAAIAAVKSFEGKADEGDALVDGKIVVGKNAAVGIGFEGREEVERLLTEANVMVNRRFQNTTDSIKAALVLNDSITIASGNGVLIDSSKTGTALSGAVSGDEFNMNGGAALIINDSVYERNAAGEKLGFAVKLEKGNGGSVKADASSKIILAGDFDAGDAGIRIFEGSGDAVQVVSGSIAVVSANGLIEGEVSSTDKKFKITKIHTDSVKEKFLTVSAPVAQLLREAAINQNHLINKGEDGGRFLGIAANNLADPSGVSADAAAHAATFAGAQQAAVAAVGTLCEAVGGRVNAIGVEASSISATGSQANGGVWLSPMYKSVDSDSFNAQGASYGADVDLGGVAFGVDTVNGNMRFGAVFNIGSGDSEGKGNGAGLKNDFDYYGFGIYSAMGFGNFALVGDASVNVISHDIEGQTSIRDYSTVNAKADTTAVTMGITGQYTIASPMLDVTPHFGARFIRLDTESYDLVSAGKKLATTDFEVQNVFSLPLGVTLSKAFEMGGWSLAPSADLTLTFNTGDTEVESTTKFTGAYGIGLTTEVLDEVTYGVALGLGAQYGAFGTNLGLSYTGSENTDSFGVNAQARYMF